MRRYERASTLLTSNRPVDDWGKLLGDTAAVTALLDRLLHHAHVLKCGPRSWRTKVQTDLRTDEGNEVELTGLGPGEIAGFALSTNCRFSTVHRGLNGKRILSCRRLGGVRHFRKFASLRIGLHQDPLQDIEIACPVLSPAEHRRLVQSKSARKVAVAQG